MDLSLSNLYKCWRLFRRGKKASREIVEFEYFLENNLRGLEKDLHSGIYKHGCYRQFEVVDNKRRLIKVAGVRDRVVHRLVYEYLKPIFDPAFIYDVWSCREGKGLIGAVKRSQKFLYQRSRGYVWRSDIKKFFDNVDKQILLQLIERKIIDNQAVGIIREIIFSQSTQIGNDRHDSGIPIGNLASQIFANIYLNELDRFIKHKLGVKFYLRYGDDFIILDDKQEILEQIRDEVREFLRVSLRLETNSHRDIIIKIDRGLRFLGAKIYPRSRQLNRRNQKRLKRKLDLLNLSSYKGMIKQYEPQNLMEINYLAEQLLNEL